MRELRFLVDVTMQRVTLDNRWVSEHWQLATVAPTDNSSPDYEVDNSIRYVQDDLPGLRWRACGLPLVLHPSEAEGYYLNLTAPDPKLFVMWRLEEDGARPPVRVVVATVSYNEAARLLDGGEQVDALPLPPALAEWVKPYVDEHYKPEPRRKNRRNDPFAEVK
jgi:Protein of unknown function (DUF3305)